MAIGERIKSLRKELKLTQAEFGEKIGLKPTAVLMYEKNQRGVSDQSIQLICQAFNVREAWLRDGEEPMQSLPSRAEEIRAWARSLPLQEDFTRPFAEKLIKLGIEDWEALLKIAQAMADESAESLAQPPAAEKAAAPEGTAAEADEQTHTEELTADEQAMLDDYRARRKKTAGSESAPPYGAPIGAG